MLMLLLACVPPVERVRTYALQADGSYTTALRRVDTLTDPHRLDGELGQVRGGGSLRLEQGGVSYRGGRTLDVLLHVQDGDAEPLDQEGLVLLSFYAHLQDARDLLLDAGVGVSDLFPIHAAVSPAVPDLGLAVLAAENAAYVPGANTFVLLPDVFPKEVPFAANLGIVSHEFGHGVFHLLTTQDPYADPLYAQGTAAAIGVASLNEGFADMLGGLTTGRPDGFEASTHQPTRDMSQEWLAQDVSPLPRDVDTADVSPLNPYNPYPLGTVYASTVWSVVQVTQDWQGATAWVCDATSLWGERQRADPRPNDAQVALEWLDAWVELAPTDDAHDAACAAIDARWAAVHQVDACW